MQLVEYTWSYAFHVIALEPCIHKRLGERRCKEQLCFGWQRALKKHRLPYTDAHMLGHAALLVPTWHRYPSDFFPLYRSPSACHCLTWQNIWYNGTEMYDRPIMPSTTAP